MVFFECQNCRRVGAEDLLELPEEERDIILRYEYAKADGSYLLPCDEIIYLNHSCNANILDSGLGFDIVVRDIRKGEEATYDYRVFHDSQDLQFSCLCGEENCCGTVMCVHPPPRQLAADWKRKTKHALLRSGKVPQPLREALFAALKDSASVDLMKKSGLFRQSG